MGGDTGFMQEGAAFVDERPGPFCVRPESGRRGKVFGA
jgi:hypothetical protein